MDEKAAVTPVMKDRVRGDCPNCGPQRWANVVAAHSKHDSDDELGLWTHTDYRILECPACEAVYFQTDFIFSEDYEHLANGDFEYQHQIEHWPHTPDAGRKEPTWLEKLRALDENAYSLISSVYTALEKDLAVLAAIGVRTVFDRTSEFVGIDPGITFQEKLAELVKRGKIGSDQKDILDALTDAGSAAAHRGWRPTSEQLNTMMDAIESFVHNTFILGDAVKELKSSLPERQKRPPKGAEK
ncbi:DUF4145 domain-containing protein [Rhodopseudomonas palustris]|uniref:DUF4145 domain-containing protein n=1 Tax=Rhodopseudomonas palustris TaxID=1076 RepID=UPI001603EF5F|nr:DUF4145 domain-containing protein [Rhodopseudomonas palustris]